MVLEDDILVKKCLGGEKDAFGVLVSKYKDAVYGLAYSKVRNFHDAQDIAQESFIDAYRNLRSLKHPHRFSSWIYTIAANRCRMWLRKQPHEFLAFASDERQEPETQATHRNDKGPILDSVLDAINELPDATRLAMTLYYIDGLTCKEIGEFTGTSINTVMSKLRRARAKLRKEFTEMPAQTMTQQKVPSGFTTGILNTIEHISPAPPPTSNSISRIMRVPWALGLVIGFIIFGIMNINPPSNLYGVRESEEVIAVYPISGDGFAVDMVSQTKEMSPISRPPAPEESEIYAAAGSSISVDNDTQGGGLLCNLTPGDTMVYEVSKTFLDGDFVSYTIDGTRTLLISEIEEDGVAYVVNMAQEMMVAPGEWTALEAGIGLMYVGRTGSDEWRESSLPPSAGGPLMPNSTFTNLYFVPFPSEPLKQGDTWNYKPGAVNLQEATYTVLGFEEVKGYNCVILDRTEAATDFWESKARIACDIENGVIVKLDSETKKRKNADSGDSSPKYEIESVTIELTHKRQMGQWALAMEKQALGQIESALTEHPEYIYAEQEVLRQKLVEIRKQYPDILLKPGVIGMIADMDMKIAQHICSPNPFIPSVHKKLTFDSSAYEITIHDYASQTVIKKLSGNEWDGTNEDNQPVAPGLYHYRAEIGGAINEGNITVIYE